MKIPDKVISIGSIVLVVAIVYALHSERKLRKELKEAKAQVEMAKALVPGLKFSGFTVQFDGSELKKEIREANVARTQLDSANTALLESLEEYRLIKGPCCEHFCHADSTQKRIMAKRKELIKTTVSNTIRWEEEKCQSICDTIKKIVLRYTADETYSSELQKNIEGVWK